ncbi:hypothetical protein WMO24_04915 [Ruthenibacterium sp. CLA-JM-H11]|uniref:Uncharacterized protein n=1 Tax=Ruthenibacterium intestinale TaxID=3133163 RepID=A0ABV1GDJ4_9FIRM
MNLYAADTAAWKALVLRLAGVLGAEFFLENGSIREIHVLADETRSPKQIVRDIQSALSAKFGMEIDHRIISVAQIPDGARETHCRMICERLELISDRTGVSAVVHLTQGGHSFEGRAKCDATPGGRTGAIALAAVRAVDGAFSDEFHVVLEDVRRTEFSSRNCILAGLVLKSKGRSEPLLGACYEGEDPNFSVALAVLDAVNRRIAMMPCPNAAEQTMPEE